MQGDKSTGAVVVARTERVQRELAAARLMRSSGLSEIDEVLAKVARELEADIARAPEQAPAERVPAADHVQGITRNDPGVPEERTPAVVRVVLHRRVAAAR